MEKCSCACLAASTDSHSSRRSATPSPRDKARETHLWEPPGPRAGPLTSVDFAFHLDPLCSLTPGFVSTAEALAVKWRSWQCHPRVATSNGDSKHKRSKAILGWWGPSAGKAGVVPSSAKALLSLLPWAIARLLVLGPQHQVLGGCTDQLQGQSRTQQRECRQEEAATRLLLSGAPPSFSPPPFLFCRATEEGKEARGRCGSFLWPKFLLMEVVAWLCHPATTAIPSATWSTRRTP